MILLDGAMGTMIQKSGAGYRHSPETLNLSRPELITSFHRAYIEAGADIVYANRSASSKRRSKTPKKPARAPMRWSRSI